MASLNSSKKVECDLSQAGLISDPRFSPKTSGRKEDDNKHNYSFNKPLPLEKLCKPSEVPLLGTLPTPPKRTDVMVNKEQHLKSPHPPPPTKLQKRQQQFKSQPALPLSPKQKTIPSLPLQANEGPPISKENIFIIPGLNEKPPLKVPAIVHPPVPSFRLPVKESDPEKKAPVPPPHKGNTFPLPRKENAFKLPTPTGSKQLVNHISRSFSTKLNDSLSRNNLKLSSFKEDHVKGALKSFLSKSTDEESTSKKEGFTFSRLKEAKFKLLQNKPIGNKEEQPVPHQKPHSRLSSFFNEEEEAKPTLMNDKPHFIKEEINRSQEDDHDDVVSQPTVSRSDNVLLATKKTIYRRKTTVKDSIASSLSLSNRSEDFRPPTPKKHTFARFLFNDGSQDSTDDRPPTPITEVAPQVPKVESSGSQISTKKTVSSENTLPKTKGSQHNDIIASPTSMLDRAESNTGKPKRSFFKAEKSSFNDGLKTTEESTTVSSKPSIRSGLKLNLQTKDNYESKEKLPKPTSVFNGSNDFSSEKEITSIKNDSGRLSERKLTKQPSSASKINTSNNTLVDDSFRPPTPKKEFLVTSPRMNLSEVKNPPPIRLLTPQRELPIPSPNGIKGGQLQSPIQSKPLPLPSKKSLPNLSLNNIINESSSSGITRPPTPKKDIVLLSDDSSNHNSSIPKSSDKKRRNKPPPPPPLIINKDKQYHLTTTTADLVKENTLGSKKDVFKVPVLQANGAILHKPDLPIPTDISGHEVPTPRGISNLPKLPPKTFLPDIAPPTPPKTKNKLPPPVKGVPYNLARNKELAPIPEPIRLSLEEDYPNKTIHPRDIFHVEYRERTRFRNAQWYFDEFSGIYHKKIPGLLNQPQRKTSQRTIQAKKPYRTRSRLSLSRHKEPIYDDNVPVENDFKWETPKNVDEIQLMRKRSKKLRDNKAQLSLCRVLIEATSDKNDESQSSMTPRLCTKYSPESLRLKKKKDLVFDEVLILETQKLLNDLVVGKNGDFPDSEAQFLLANCYGVGGLGFPLDRERAFQLYIHASKQNHIESIYRAGVCYELGIGTNQDFNRAMSFYRKAAIYSHVASMYKLGIILLKGHCGQTRNIREALSWLQRAAASSSTKNPHALYALAMLQLDEGCPDTNLIADAAYAIDLLHESAKLDYAPSQVKLGELYEAGRWVEVDDALSIYWYTRAAEAGNSDAALALSCWYLTGSPGILEQSDQQAFLWAYKAAMSKTADRWTVAKAMFLIGVYIEIGITSTPEDAKSWFRKAAALGHKGAVEKIKNPKAICYTDELL